MVFICLLLPFQIMEKSATAPKSFSKNGFHLLVLEEDNFKRAICLEDSTYSIGRSANNSVVISSQDVSRYHTTIIRRTHIKTSSVSFWILDGDLQGNRSTNGILVNQKKCLVHELKHKDRIDFSPKVKAYYYIVQSDLDSDDLLNLYSSIEQGDRSPSKPLTPTIVSAQNDVLEAQPPLLDRIKLNSRNENEHDSDRQSTIVPKNQAFYDLVTDLLNHILFSEQLSTALSLAKRNQYPLAVLSIDLNFEGDHFSAQFSNQLLQSFTERVKSCLRSGDVFARWKDDQFAILLTQIDRVESAAKVSKRILAALEKPLAIENQVHLHSRIGIAVFPEDGEDPNTLLAHSQAALAQSHTSAYQFYNPIIISKNSERAKVKHLFHQALDQQEFRLVYQPQVNVKAKQICGVEAFLRWSHPEVGALSPARLIELSEEFELSVPLSEWVLRTACAQNKAWQEAGIPALRMSLNLSPQQFHQPNLVDMVAQVLQQTGLEPNWLELELTETALIEAEFASRALNQLQKLGVYASIDHFGAGHASLHYLKNFPLSSLKIDRSLVHSLNGESQSQTMISALIALGQIFDLKVVAQGVETAQQLHQLRRLQCEQMQGDRLSPPLEAEKLIRLFTYLPDLKFPPKKQKSSLTR